MSDKKILKKSRYRAAIIGAGRIGATYDAPETGDVLTHAHGYVLNDAIDFIGFYDTDAQKSKNAAKVWSGKNFASLDALLEGGQPDIVSVCTPDENHAVTLERVLKYRPKLVICEKPVTASAGNTERILKIARQENVPILVNYSHRFDSAKRKFQRALQKKEYGEALLATGTYMKGTLHIGSHLIDLARFFFGEVKGITPLFTREDFTPTDKSVAAFLSFEGCPQFHLAVGDSRCYHLIELDIVFEKKRVRFIDTGHKKLTYAVQIDKHGVKRLGEPTEELMELRRAAASLVSNAVAHLDTGEPLLCSIEDALKTQLVCEKLKS